MVDAPNFLVDLAADIIDTIKYEMANGTKHYNSYTQEKLETSDDILEALRNQELSFIIDMDRLEKYIDADTEVINGFRRLEEMTF